MLHRFLDVENIGIVFLMGVLTSALWYGLAPGIFTCIVSALAFNFFFLPPIYTFTIADPESIVTFVFFLIVAGIASNLTARVRGQAVAARQRARMTEDLYLFSKKLAGTATLDDVLWATAFQIASMLKVRVVLLLPEDGTISVKAGYPPEDTLDPADIAAAKWAWENDRPAGRGADTLPGAKRLFMPMRTARGPIGVVGIDDDGQGPLLTPERRRLMDALIDQAALAIERVNLVEDLDNAKLAAEADRLRSALLTSISHDLKTPLASIMGAAGTLREFAGALEQPAKEDLLATIIDESERLNRFIANLLDMTRLESGAIEPNFGVQATRRYRRGRAFAGAEDPCIASRRSRSAAGSADGEGRSRALRTDYVQPVRQCGQIFRSRFRNPHSGIRQRQYAHVAGTRRRAWDRGR